MYEITKTGTKLVFSDVKDFDLDHVFDCGQCFRWRKEDSASIPAYYGVVGEDFARVSFKEKENEPDGVGKIGDLIIESYQNNENFWIKYLDLDRDYKAIKNQLVDGDPIMGDAIEQGWGIRIMRQDAWETLISFIISQNSNIPRIRSSIEVLCSEYGRKIGEYRDKIICTFPTLDDLASLKEEDYKVCRLGYRAKYIAEASRQIKRDGGSVLNVAASMNDKDVLKYLLTLSGIGPKVASCIMLFSMGKLNIFPVDVWVKRVMNRLYSIEETDIKGMKEYADKNFGRYGGIAQQYLFYYIRTLSLTQPKRYEELNMGENPKDKEL